MAKKRPRPSHRHSRRAGPPLVQPGRPRVLVILRNRSLRFPKQPDHVPPTPTGQGGMTAVGSDDDSQEGSLPPTAPLSGDRNPWEPFSQNATKPLPPPPGPAAKSLAKP
eukprot:3179682-Pyramimonas_sp.AAC.1